MILNIVRYINLYIDLFFVFQNILQWKPKENARKYRHFIEPIQCLILYLIPFPPEAIPLSQSLQLFFVMVLALNQVS